MCINWYQNSGTQGPLLGRVVTKCAMSAGDKLLIKIEGGCSQFAPTANTVQTKGILHKRQTISISDSNTTLRNPFADGSLTYVAVNLGDLGPGTYNLQVSLGGQVDNLTVLDSDGETYAKYGPAAPFPVPRLT